MIHRFCTGMPPPSQQHQAYPVWLHNPSYCTDSGEPRPVMVFLPWMTATQSLADRYRELYACRGFNVLTVWGKLSYFLWPQWAMPLASELADYLSTQTKGPLVIHSMSVGAYLYAMTLRYVIDERERYADLVSRVRGQVYDSIVIGTLHEMAVGVSLVVAPKSSILQGLFMRACLLYFAATRRRTVVPYGRAIDAVYDSPFRTPVLCFYSLSDVLCQPAAMRRLIAHWRKENDMHVTEKYWENSPHAMHLKYDPNSYHACLDELLAEIKLNDIPCHFQSKL